MWISFELGVQKSRDVATPSTSLHNEVAEEVE